MHIMYIYICTDVYYTDDYDDDDEEEEEEQDYVMVTF